MISFFSTRTLIWDALRHIYSSDFHLLDAVRGDLNPYILPRPSSIDTMKILYTKHAEERIRARNIGRKDIRNAIEKPDEIVENDVKIAHKFMNGKMLRVVFKNMGNSYIVITAYITYKKRYRGV